MNLALPEEAVDFGAAATKAFTAMGAIDAARRAETEPEIRSGLVAQTLEGLGAGDVDPRDDLASGTAAAELCRVAGRFVVPYPLVSFVLRDHASDLPLGLVGRSARIDHGDVFPTWILTSLDGGASMATPVGTRLDSKLGPFVTDLTTSGPARAVDPSDVALHLTLTAWRILGVTERALELAVEYVRSRVQFGQTLAAFQAVQFQLADAYVATEGLRELCQFTLWRAYQALDAVLVDALALRLQALEVARAVLRTSQQLHGASGLCDEYDVSVLCRHVQPDLRLPFAADRTATELVDAVAQFGFEGLFPQLGRSQ